MVSVNKRLAGPGDARRRRQPRRSRARLGAGLGRPRQRRAGEGRVCAYFADWDVYGRGYHVKDIPATKINVIQYAFGVPTFDPTTGAVGCDILDPWADYQQPYTADMTVNGVADDSADANQHLYGSFNQLQELKAANPNLKVEISLGGWTKSTWFSHLAATPERGARRSCRPASTRSSRATCRATAGRPSAGGDGAAAGLFDGIDIDWEYPTAGRPAATSMSARPTGTTRRCWLPSSASSSTRMARRPASTTC